MKSLVLALLFAACSWAQSPLPAGGAEEMRIVPDDILDVVVFREPELTRTIRVSPSGMISMPVAGNLNAAGLTTDALAKKIKTLLEENLTDPDVTVMIKEFATQTISVIGAVRTPGAFPVREAVPLLSLLAKAGSITENADDTIQIIRKSADEPLTIVGTADLLRNGRTELNIPIFPGDTVNVVPKPAAAFVMVVGEVLRSGEIPMRIPSGITVRQALAAAGWFTPSAKRKDAKIIRIHPEDGAQEEIPVNLSDVTDASFADVSLQPNDILFVPSSKSRIVASRALDAAIGITSTRLIYVGR